MLDRHKWPAWRDALVLAHRSEHPEARDRLAYDELLANSLALMLVKDANRKRRGQPLKGDGRLRGKLALPFPLTGAQKRSIGEIEGDLAQQSPMLRLLQGDVGSGKTVVALEAMLIAVEAGAQAAMLAPTEILARQHYETLRAMAGPTGRQRRAADRPRQGQGARVDPDGPGRRQHRRDRRHPRDLPGHGRLPEPRPRGDRRAAQVRRQPAPAADAEGPGDAALPRHDRHPDPAHADSLRSSARWTCRSSTRCRPGARRSTPAWSRSTGSPT